MESVRYAHSRSCSSCLLTPLHSLAEADGTVDVHDQTGANVVNLRRTIYLTIMSALDFEEAVHKLLKINIAEGQEVRSRFHGLARFREADPHARARRSRCAT